MTEVYQEHWHDDDEGDNFNFGQGKSRLCYVCKKYSTNTKKNLRNPRGKVFFEEMKWFVNEVTQEMICHDCAVSVLKCLFCEKKSKSFFNPNDYLKVLLNNGVWIRFNHIRPYFLERICRNCLKNEMSKTIEQMSERFKIKPFEKYEGTTNVYFIEDILCYIFSYLVFPSEVFRMLGVCKSFYNFLVSTNFYFVDSVIFRHNVREVYEHGHFPDTFNFNVKTIELIFFLKKFPNFKKNLRLREIGPSFTDFGVLMLSLIFDNVENSMNLFKGLGLITENEQKKQVRKGSLIKFSGSELNQYLYLIDFGIFSKLKSLYIQDCSGTIVFEDVARTLEFLSLKECNGIKIEKRVIFPNLRRLVFKNNAVKNFRFKNFNSSPKLSRFFYENKSVEINRKLLELNFESMKYIEIKFGLRKSKNKEVVEKLIGKFNEGGLRSLKLDFRFNFEISSLKRFAGLRILNLTLYFSTSEEIISLYETITHIPGLRSLRLKFCENDLLRRDYLVNVLEIFKGRKGIFKLFSLDSEDTINLKYILELIKFDTIKNILVGECTLGEGKYEVQPDKIYEELVKTENLRNFGVYFGEIALKIVKPQFEKSGKVPLKYNEEYWYVSNQKKQKIHVDYLLM